MTHSLPALHERVDDVAIQHDHITLIQDQLARFLLDSIPDSFLVLNNTRQAVFINQALMKALTKADASDLLGLRPGELLHCVHAIEEAGGCGMADACKLCGAFNAVRGALLGEAHTEECRITTEEGTALDLRIWSRPLRLNGRQMVILIMKDIEDEKRRHLLEHTFFHDIMNTASVIYAYADMARTEPDVLQSEFIVEAARRLVDEIHSQRLLLAAEEETLAVQMRPVRVNRLLHTLAALYSDHAVGRGKQIYLSVPEEEHFFTSDETLLGRVVGNMLKNALEATPPGGRVTLSYVVTADQIAIHVHNASVMPRAVQLQLFQRSFSTKGAGRGIGTYSMRLLAEKYLEGKVHFISTPEQGTTFTVTLPLHHTSEVPALR